MTQHKHSFLDIFVILAVVIVIANIIWITVPYLVEKQLVGNMTCSISDTLMPRKETVVEYMTRADKSYYIICDGKETEFMVNERAVIYILLNNNKFNCKYYRANIISYLGLYRDTLDCE